MSNKAKKWLVVACGLTISAVLIIAISTQFSKPSVTDAPLPSQSTEVQDVAVEKPDITEKEITVPPIEIPDQTETEKENSAVDVTEQAIQTDPPEKPTYTEEQLKNPNQKPNGEKVTEEDKPVEHNNVEQPTSPLKQENQPQGGDVNAKGETYLPGFGWIENSGENQGSVAEDMYENGNKVGIMGE